MISCRWEESCGLWFGSYATLQMSVRLWIRLTEGEEEEEEKGLGAR